jgi:hypothetical protein
VRKTILVSGMLALVAAGAVTVAAAGGAHSRAVDVHAANGRTQHATSVHYTLSVRMTKRKQPLTLHVAGASSRDAVSVHLRLGDLVLKDGTRVPGMRGAMLMSKPFLYEAAPNGIAVFGNIRWLRLKVDGLSPRSQTLSTLHALTPAPLLRLVAESRLRPTGRTGSFSGPVRYDDPVVRTALTALGGGIEFRNLRLFVHVGQNNRIDSLRLTGRTADGKTTLALHAKLFDFGKPVKIVPPKPGTFMDQTLAQLRM